MMAAALTCMALNVYFEARGETLLGQLGVAETTINRVKSPRYPDTVCEVVWQRKQFSWTHDGKSDKPTDSNAWAQAQEVARIVLENEGTTFIGEDITHFHADYVRPYWAGSYEKVAQVGTHIFYKPRG